MMANQQLIHKVMTILIAALPVMTLSQIGHTSDTF
jgi:pyridoxal biosynthesis lyase PdxS